MTAAVAQAFECEHCEDRRAIDSPTLGVIRCPRCTRRELKRDPSGLEQITREEAERREQRAIDQGEHELTPKEKAEVDLAWVRVRLAQWGRWCRERGTGYPSHAAHESMRTGSVFSSRGMPPEIEEIDKAVALIDQRHKIVLVEYYTKAGTPALKAANLGMTRPNFYRRKELAELALLGALRG